VLSSPDVLHIIVYIAGVIGFVQARSWYQDLTPIVVTSPPN
jgi:hypothetical protein